MIKPFMNGQRGALERQGAAAQVGAARAARDRDARRRLRAEGARGRAAASGDGVIIQLADPDIIQWIMDDRAQGRRGGGPRPGRAQVHRQRAEPRHRRPRRRARAGALVPGDGLEPRQDLIDRYGTDGSTVPKALTDYVQARKFYDYNEHSRVGAKHGEFVTDEICDRFCVIGDDRAVHGEAARARGDRRRPVQHLPDDARPGGDAPGLRRRHHPAVRAASRPR